MSLFPDTVTAAPSPSSPAAEVPGDATPVADGAATSPGTSPAAASTPKAPVPRVAPPTVVAATAPEPDVATAQGGGRWKPAGLSGRSAFFVETAERDDPYGRRPPGVAELSLDQISRFALDNPLVAAAEQRVIAMEALLSKAKFAWIPVVDTTATLSPGANIQCDDVRLDDGSPQGFAFQFCRSGANEDLDINTIRGYFGQLAEAGVRFSFRANTVIPVFSFGRKLKHYKALGRAGVALAQLRKLATEQETMLRVRQAHVTLLLARESQGILLEAKKVIDKAYTRVVADVGDPEDWAADIDEGDDARDPDDLTKIELAAVELEVKMREALKAESLALAALWALAGNAAPKGFDIAERRLSKTRVRGGLRSVQDYIEIANITRPEAKMAAAAVKARKAQERLARAAFLPDLGIAMSFGVGISNAADPQMSNLYYQDGFNYSSFTAALAVRWRWDTGAIFELRRTRAEFRAQEYEQQAARLLLGQDVHRAYQDLIEARSQMDAAERAAALSWRLVLSQEVRDAGGGGESGELLRALEKWYTARFDSASAVFAHSEATARLSRSIGRPIPTVDGALDRGAPAHAAEAVTPVAQTPIPAPPMGARAARLRSRQPHL